MIDFIKKQIFFCQGLVMHLYLFTPVTTSAEQLFTSLPVEVKEFIKQNLSPGLGTGLFVYTIWPHQLNSYWLHSLWRQKNLSSKIFCQA